MVKILNKDAEPKLGKQEQEKILSEFYTVIHEIWQEFITKEGVDFKAFWASSKFKDYLDVACNLQNLDMAALSEKDRKCFCINLYNFMAMHILIKLDLPDDILSDKAEGKSPQTGVINDPLSQTHSPDSSDHYFHLKNSFCTDGHM